MTRTRAASIHLLLSIFVAATALIIMIAFMYPWKYFNASGGRDLLFILVTVDVIIGPLLTFIVYKEGKKSLKFDLSVIVFLQLAALVYGLFIILSSRPIFMTLVNDRFHLVQANEITDDALNDARDPQFSKRSWSGPIMAVTKMPTDPDEQQTVLMNAIAGADMDKFPAYYYPYADNAQQALDSARPLLELRVSKPESSSRIDAFVRTQANKSIDAFVYLPVMTKRSSLTAVLNAASGELIEILEIDPWLDN